MSNTLCEHDWNDSSVLHLTIRHEGDELRYFLGGVPKGFPVSYCRTCGAVRIGPTLLDMLAQAERKAAAAAPAD